MKKGDFVYVSVELSDNRIDNIVSEYNDENVGNYFLFETIKIIGFKREDLEYFARFNTETSEIETIFKIKTVPEKLKGLNLTVGDEIIIATSLKPKLQNFKRIIQRHFKTVDLFVNNEKSYAGAICYKE